MKLIAHYLDLANHHANATYMNIQTICQAVIKNHFNAAFVNPTYITYAKQLLKGNAKIGSVVSFPLGQELLEIKKASAEYATRAGADEIDVSLNVAFIKEAQWGKLSEEMRAIIHAARSVKESIIIKCIPETGYLTPHEIQKTAEIMVQQGVDFFKTCSGMGPRGAIVDDVLLVRQAVGNAIKIKVAGGIESYSQACEFIKAGADRIGTSHAVEIVNQCL